MRADGKSLVMRIYIWVLGRNVEALIPGKVHSCVMSALVQQLICISPCIPAPAGVLHPATEYNPAVAQKSSMRFRV